MSKESDFVDLLNKEMYELKIADLEAKLAESEEQLKEELVEKKGLERALSACNRQNDEFAEMIKKLVSEKEELKQQLHDLPKKIVEYFYDEIRHRAILEDDYCPDHNIERKYGVRKCLLENIRTTILKKYGGEDESNND